MIDNWYDLKVGQFKKLMALPEGEDEDRYWKVLAILNDTTVDDIMSRPLLEVSAMRKKADFLNEYPKVPASKHKYQLGDTTYIFTDHIGDICVAQYVDFTNLPEGAENISDVMCVVLVPDGHKYNDGYSMDKVKEDVDKYLSFMDARAMSGFFLGSFILSLDSQRRSLKKMIRKARKMGLDTDEAERSLESLNGTLRSLGYSVR